MELVAIISVLIIVIISLVIFAIMQLKMAGIEVKDFWSFVNANQELDKLYNFALKYEKMSPQEQIIFLQAAEKMSDAYEKIPTIVWEDDYQKYRDVMDIYRNIKMSRWESSTRYIPNNK